MRAYALLKNNLVTEVRSMTDDECRQAMQQFDLVVDVEDIAPRPAVGWSLTGNQLSPTPVAPLDMNRYVKEVVYRPAVAFGKLLIEDFTTENIMMGITQAGKTKVVGEALEKLAFWASMGSLYEVLAEVERLKLTLDGSLAPFVTAERLDAFKAEVRTYLGLS